MIEGVYKTVEQMKEYRRELLKRGYVSAHYLSVHYGLNVTPLRKLAKLGRIDAVHININGTTKWYYPEEEAVNLLNPN